MELPQVEFISKGQDGLLSTLESNQSNYDGLVVIFTEKKALADLLPVAQKYMDLDSTFGDSVQLLVTHDGKPAERIVVSPTGTIYNDFDDVRRFKDAAYAAGIKALKAGMRRPLVCFADEPSSSLAWSFDADQDDYQHFAAVTLMGLFESTFEPVDVRQHVARTQGTVKTFESLGFVADVDAETVKTIRACEMGRRVAKDIGNPDPEIMSPIHITEYIQEQFKDVDNIKLTIIDDIDVIKKEYPLAHAVTRASLAVPRHHPRFILFEYTSPDQSQVKENLYFVGKGVTYDTGGADIKCSGHMRDMSRDKCGAAAVAGFFKTVSLLAPTKVNVTGGLALVRNSVGPDMYVSDEIIVARSGKRVMVGNTDAEGRMVMTDLLCQFKEKVLEHKQANTPSSAAPSFLFTCATLTGHAIRAYGGYGITLDNGFARKHKISKRIYNAGHVLGDPFEISTLRREDVECVKGGRSSEDLVSANDLPSTMTSRGHQYPAGFMLQASGLDQYGLDNRELSIGYTHLDVAGSAELLAGEGWSIPRVTGSPVAALTGAFLF